MDQHPLSVQTRQTKARETGFDTMRSFRYLNLTSTPRNPDPAQHYNALRRQDSGILNEPKGLSQQISRGNKPSALTDVPSFQATKARWSPPSSPTATTPVTSPIASPRCSAAQVCTSKPSLNAKQRTTLVNELFSAACSGNITAMETLLSRGASINGSVMVSGLFEAFKPAKAGNLSPLAGAAYHGQFEAVELLLAHGAEINLPSIQCASSPLHQAIRNNDLELTRLLLEQGADIDIDNAYKTTPIMYAARYGNAELVSLLLEHKPNLHKLSFTQTAAIHWSVWPGDAKITELLLKAGASPNHPMGHTGNSPLHCAVVTGNVNMVKCLLRYGANPRQRNEENQTAFHLAASQPDMEEIIGLMKACVAAKR